MSKVSAQKDDDLAPLIRPARILVVDFERLPGLAPVWQQRTDFLPARDWVRYPSTLCLAWSWYGKRRTHFAAVWDDGGHDAMVKTHWQLYDDADLVITYNGKRADNRWARDDWASAGLPAPRPWKDLDLYAVNKSLFGWDSFSLDHLCKRLGIEGKTGHYSRDDAEAAANGDTKAQARLARYNRGDVRATTAAFEALRPWLAQRMPHLGLWSGHDRSCQVCGGTDFTPAGDVPAVTTVYAGYRCTSCGTLSRSNHRRRAVSMRAART